MSVTAGVSDAVITVRDKLRGKIGQTKVKRYFPGKAPEWADDVDQDGDIRASSSASLESAFPMRHYSEPSAAAGRDDPRLRRLAQSSAASRDEARADHRRIRQAEIVSTRAEEEEEEERRAAEDEELEDADEAALEERRRRIKERSRLRELEQSSLLPAVKEEDEEEEEEGEESGSSEYETGSDSEGEGGGVAMVKPVFVAKAGRETVAERERVEEREAEAEEAERRKLDERKKETKQLVVEVIRREEESRKTAAEEEAADVDTDDEANEAEEYEAWKAREMGRIKRDRDDRDALFKDREEVERLRKMTEEERREWERRNPKQGPSSSSGGRQQKEKWKFMQKYFHKGAFFQERPDDVAATAGAEAIYARDFSAPTGDDKMDKTNLPKIMQVKHFGRSGRTKWTHLVNEDTTDWNNPWMSNDALRAKYNEKMAGNNTPIEKPKGSKKLKDWERR